MKNSNVITLNTLKNMGISKAKDLLEITGSFSLLNRLKVPVAE